MDSFRCRWQTALQNHVACLIQDAVMACSVSQVQADGQLWLIEDLVPARRHSANLLHSRSPFSCASSTSINWERIASRVDRPSHPIRLTRYRNSTSCDDLSPLAQRPCPERTLSAAPPTS